MERNLETKTTQTIRIDIFIGGDIAQAKQVCREFCFEKGLCVTVQPIDYIYTGGEEAGVRIGLINYARFPTSIGPLRDIAHELADKLMERLSQHSLTIVEPTETHWKSRRPA